MIVSWGKSKPQGYHGWEEGFSPNGHTTTTNDDDQGWFPAGFSPTPTGDDQQLHGDFGSGGIAVNEDHWLPMFVPTPCRPDDEHSHTANASRPDESTQWCFARQGRKTAAWKAVTSNVRIVRPKEDEDGWLPMLVAQR